MVVANNVHRGSCIAAEACELRSFCDECGGPGRGLQNYLICVYIYIHTCVWVGMCKCTCTSVYIHREPVMKLLMFLAT